MIAASAGTARAMLAEGARAITPMVIGAVPFGLAIGAAIGSADVDPVAAWAGSFLLLAGSAHLTIVQLLDGGAAPVVVVLAALAINTRLLLYGAGLARWFPRTRLPTRLLLAYPLVDQTYLTAVTRFERGDLDERARRLFFAGVGLHLSLAWVAAQTAGLLLGSRVPAWLGLHAAASLALAGLLAASTRTGRVSGRVAPVAAVVAVAAGGLPHRSATLVAIAAGVAAGFSGRKP